MNLMDAQGILRARGYRLKSRPLNREVWATEARKDLTAVVHCQNPDDVSINWQGELRERAARAA